MGLAELGQNVNVVADESEEQEDNSAAAVVLLVVWFSHSSEGTRLLLLKLVTSENAWWELFGVLDGVALWLDGSRCAPGAVGNGIA